MIDIVYLAITDPQNTFHLCSGKHKLHVSRFGDVTASDIHVTGSYTYWELVTPISNRVLRLFSLDFPYKVSYLHCLYFSILMQLWISPTSLSETFSALGLPLQRGFECGLWIFGFGFLWWRLEMREGWKQECLKIMEPCVIFHSNRGSE